MSIYKIFHTAVNNNKHEILCACVSVFLPVSLHANHTFCAPYSGVLCGVSGCTIFFPHYLITSMISGYACSDFLYNFCPKNISHSTNNSATIINLRRSSSKATVILVRFQSKLNFLNRCLKTPQISTFKKIHQLKQSCSQTGRQAHRHDKSNSHLRRTIRIE